MKQITRLETDLPRWYALRASPDFRKVAGTLRVPSAPPVCAPCYGTRSVPTTVYATHRLLDRNLRLPRLGHDASLVAGNAVRAVRRGRLPGRQPDERSDR